MTLPIPLISSNPERLGGEPCFTGTRVPVRALIDYIEGGHPLAEFLADFPTVSREHAVAVNLALSSARAAAVKAALVADFGINGARVTTKGLGDTAPSAPNATATGRAQNRRVEIVRQ